MENKQKQNPNPNPLPRSTMIKPKVQSQPPKQSPISTGTYQAVAHEFPEPDDPIIVGKLITKKATTYGGWGGWGGFSKNEKNENYVTPEIIQETEVPKRQIHANSNHRDKQNGYGHDWQGADWSDWTFGLSRGTFFCGLIIILLYIGVIYYIAGKGQ